MRISDWSSDVCSSDLVGGDEVAVANAKEKGATLKTIVRDHLDGSNGRTQVEGWVPKWMSFPPAAYTERAGSRTEERRVGKECGRTGRSRWQADHSKKKKEIQIGT